MKTNKANWTGDECTVTILDTVKCLFTIGMEGYTFQLSSIPDPDFEMYKVTCIEEPNWKWLGYRDNNRVTFFSGSINRSEDSAYTAFARLAWCVI